MLVIEGPRYQEDRTKRLSVPLTSKRLRHERFCLGQGVILARAQRSNELAIPVTVRSQRQAIPSYPPTAWPECRMICPFTTEILDDTKKLRLGRAPKVGSRGG